MPASLPRARGQGHWPRKVPEVGYQYQLSGTIINEQTCAHRGGVRAKAVQIPDTATQPLESMLLRAADDD